MKYHAQHISSPEQIKTIEFKNFNNSPDQHLLINSLQNFFVDKYENISHDITIENYAPFITLKTTSIDGPIKMMIDTGASVSIISSRIIPPEKELQNIKCRLFGLGSSTDGILSMGLLHTNTIINGVSLGLSLHVIDQKFLGRIDGFLGFDFLTNYRTNIDIENKKIYFKLNDLHTKKSEQMNKKPEKQPSSENQNNQGEPSNSLKSVPIENKNELFNYMEAMHFFYAEDENRERLKVKPVIKEIPTGRINAIRTIKNTSIINCVDLKNHQKITQELEQESNKIIKLRSKSNDTNMAHIFGLNLHTFMKENTKNIDETSEFNSKQMTMNSHENGEKILKNINDLENWWTIPRYHINKLENIKTLEDRIQFIYKKLKTSHCLGMEIKSVEEFCRKYPYQFYVDGDNLGCTSVIKHHIKIIPGSKIINIKQYRIPQTHREILLKIVDDYEKQGIIEKCQSNYNSPAILVPKRDDDNGKTDHRFVVDYRKLNEICQISNFPIPHIDDILDGLGGCKFFTTLDIKGAFHQIVLDETSRDFTAFTAGHFQYRWVRMPMGLSEAPLTWQRAINTILAEVIGKGVYIYLDDVIIYSKTIEEHNKTLYYVLETLKKHNLQMKISKCYFYAKKFDFLGFIISEAGISANPRKIDTIQNFPVPRNVKQVQSFLGILNYYRRFVRNFAKIAKPLTTLCKQDYPFIWTDNTQKAFEELKTTLITDVVLKFPNFEEIFYVTTDASDVAIGAVLSQGDLPNDRPICFFSRTLNDCQKRYSTIQKELLAIVEAIKAFRVYLYGRFFVLITDHKPLCYLFNMKDCGSRLFRQRLELMDYNFKILHRAGTQNTVADALSRIEPISIEEALEIENGTQKINALTRAQAKNELTQSKQNDPTFGERDGTILNKRGFDIIFHLVPTENDWLKNKLTNKFGITNFPENWHNFNHYHFLQKISNQFAHANNMANTYKCISEMREISTKKNAESMAINIDFDSIRHYFHFKNILHQIFEKTNISITLFLNKIVEIIERDDIQAILDLYHKSLLGGHFGIDKMQKTISKFYKWKNMSNDIKNYVSGCEICQKTKVITNTKVPMQISSLGDILFDHTYVDFVGPISPPSADGHKYIFTATCDLTKYMVAVPTRDCSAITTAESLLENILLKYNFPSRLISDNASNFNSKVIHELAKTLQIRKIFTTPYHPQSNIVERGHRTLNAYLSAFSSKNRDNWHHLLKYAMFAYNNAIHTTTGYTPHELAHGFRINIPNHLFKPKLSYNYDNLADLVRNNIANALELAKEKLYGQKMINKQIYDKNAKNLDIRMGDQILLKTQAKTDKFQPVYEGPYEVLETYNEYIEIKKNGRRVKVHKNLIKKLNDHQPFPSINLNETNLISLIQ